MINASGPAPRAATHERYAGGIPRDGILTVSVPGAVDGWLELAARFGTRPLAELFEAAIGYARDGFGCTRRLRDFIVQEEALLRRYPSTGRYFLPDGAVPRGGSTRAETATPWPGSRGAGRPRPRPQGTDPAESCSLLTSGKIAPATRLPGPGAAVSRQPRRLRPESRRPVGSAARGIGR